MLGRRVMAVVVVMVASVKATTTTPGTTPGIGPFKRTCKCFDECDKTQRDSVDHKAVNDFGIRLFQLVAPGGNVLISPISLWSTITLAYTGSRKETCEQLQRLLGVSYKLDAHEFLDSMEESNINKPAGKLSVYQMSRVYKDVNFNIPPCSKDYLWERMFSIRFHESGEAAKLINNFVREATYHLIPTIVNEKQLTGTRLGMEGAGFFNGQWKYGSRPVCSTLFYPTTDSGSVYVSMIWMTQKFRAGHSQQLFAKLVQVPYSSRMSMYLLLPDQPGEEGFMATVNALTTNTLLTALESLELNRTHVFFPKFKMRGSYGHNLHQHLKHLGTTHMFDKEKANFYYFSGNLYVTDTDHRAVVEINEWETKAAVASNVHIKPKSYLTPRTVTPSNRSGVSASSSIDVNLEANAPGGKPGEGGCTMEMKAQRSGCDDDVFMFNRPFVYLLVDDHDKVLWLTGTFRSPAAGQAL